LPFTTRALSLDAKNYNTWAYRQWALCHFWGPQGSGQNKDQIWEGELRFAEGLLNDDVRNNSAWNHRFFVVFESGMGGGEKHVDREIG
jgi:protein farnesyltransferase/geranylgeranyltransferase type-1 subunit alpha